MAKTETTEETPLRSQMWKHEDFVEWASEDGYLDSDAEQAMTIAVFAAKRNEYRKTSRYRDLVESHREEAEEAKKTAAAERKAKRDAEKAAEAKTAKAPAKATKATKSTTRRGKSVNTTAEENPFDEE